MKYIDKLLLDVAESNVDLSTAVKKAYIVAKKLELTDFIKLFDGERNGYKNENIPEYRKVMGRVQALNTARGWIPVQGTDELGINIYSARESINELEFLLQDNKSNSIVVEFGDKINNALSNGMFCKFRLNIPSNALVSILNSVENLLVDWLLKIQELGLNIDGIEYTNEQKEIAKSSSTLINNYFYGNVQDSKIQQQTKDSNQE